MAIREDIRFSFDGGIKLGAWLYLPDGPCSRCTAITLAHGYAGTREHGIAKFAEAFAAAGFIVLLHGGRQQGHRGPTSHRTNDAIDFYLQPLGAGERWDNVVTVRSTRLARICEPGVWAPSIGPKPIVMIVATQDTVTLTDLALEAYERAHQPKKLVMIPDGHFDPYLSGFDASCDAALQWFQEHLGR